MATYLFNTDEEFKAVIGAGINQSLGLQHLGPTMLIAFEAHLLQWIGNEQWGDLVDAVESQSFTPEQTALLPYLQRPLALLTMYEYTKIGELQVSASGFMRAETENMKGAYKNQINRYQEYMQTNGYAALESALEYMQTNKDNYPLWTADVRYQRNREAFINTAADFQLVYSANISRYVMETLRGVMLDVEEFALLPLLGQPFFEELKAAIAAESTTVAQVTVIKYIKKAVASFTVEEGIRRNLVQNKGIAIVVNEKLEPQGNIREGSPDSNKLQLALRHNDEFGNRWINMLKEFLTTNRESYATYDTWLTAQEEEAEALAQEEQTISYRNSDNCGWTTPKPTNQSVFKL